MPQKKHIEIDLDKILIPLTCGFAVYFAWKVTTTTGSDQAVAWTYLVIQLIAMALTLIVHFIDTEE